MEPTINELPGSKVELKFTVSPEEAKPYLDKAVEDLSLGKPIPGFRPGKAPYAEVAKAVGGEMAIWQAALEQIVRAWYVKTVLQNELETVGSPEIAVDQLTPGQEIKFTCTASIMPKMTKAFEIEKPFVTCKFKEVKDEEVEKAIEELRAMRRQEIISLKPAQKDGLVVIDLEMKKDNVLLEGGQAKDYRVYLSEAHYIPNFAEQLIGVNKGDHKTFTLPFPKDHFQKLYAGQDIDFDVTVKEVYEVKLPEVNDEFAKSLGVESVQALKDLLRKNIASENDRKSMEAAEIELLETLIEKSSFTEIPELLTKEEVRRMFEEMRQDIEYRGGRMEDYLSSLKKSADEFKLDMIPQADKRVKTAVYIRHVAKEQNIEVPDEEINNELDRQLNMTQDKEAKERISSPEYRDYLGTLMRNRKTLAYLKQQGIVDYEKIMDRFRKEEEEHAHQHGEEGHVHGPECHHE